MQWMRVVLAGIIRGVSKFSEFYFTRMEPSGRDHAYTYQMISHNLRRGAVQDLPSIPPHSYSEDFDFMRVEPVLYGYNVRDVVEPMSVAMLSRVDAKGSFRHAFNLVSARFGPRLTLSQFNWCLRRLSFTNSRGHIAPVMSSLSAHISAKYEFVCAGVEQWVVFVNDSFQGEIFCQGELIWCIFKAAYHDMMFVSNRIADKESVKFYRVLDE